MPSGGKSKREKYKRVKDGVMDFALIVWLTVVCVLQISGYEGCMMFAKA